MLFCRIHFVDYKQLKICEAFHPNMPHAPLKKLYENLTADKSLDSSKNGNICIEYSGGANAKYPETLDGKINELTALELLEVSCKYPHWEHVAIACFEGETRVFYGGEDANSLRNTLHELHLHKTWSDNVGERVFMDFRDQYACRDIDGGDCNDLIAFEQRMVPGTEQHYKFILKKLIGLYVQRGENQYAENSTVLGGKFIN